MSTTTQATLRALIASVLLSCNTSAAAAALRDLPFLDAEQLRRLALEIVA